MSRRKSVAEHIENGTYRPCLHGPRPGAARAFAPDEGKARPPAKPEGMNPIASQFWDDVVRLKKAVVRESDGPQLEQLCSWWALWHEAENALMNHQVGTLPYARTLTAVSLASQNFDRIAKRFGLTPADRAALKAEQSGPIRPQVVTRPKTKLDKKGPPR